MILKILQPSALLPWLLCTTDCQEEGLMPYHISGSLNLELWAAYFHRARIERDKISTLNNSVILLIDFKIVLQSDLEIPKGQKATKKMLNNYLVQ